MRAVTTLLLLLVAIRAPAAEVAIEGPDEMTIGARPIRLDVTGTTIGELVAGEAKLILYPREGAETWDAATWSGEPYVLFFADRPGRYLLALAFCRAGGLVYCEHEVSVSGGPSPNPIPPPTPGKLFCLVLEESRDRTAQAEVVKQQLADYLTAREIPYRMDDQHLIDASGKTPAWMVSYLAWLQRETIPLPALVVSVTPDGGAPAFYGKALPATAAEAIAFIKTFEGE